MAVSYQREFFDRTYTAREAYARVWKYARRYRWRIFLGLFCGLLTAGTLVPIFQVVQPALEQISKDERLAAVRAELDAVEKESAAALPEVAAETAQSELESEIAAKSRLPGWFPKAERLARKVGIDLTSENGEMRGALLLIAVFVIPLVALFRLGLVFLNQYCLAWAASHVVTDLRKDLLRRIQEQSVQFHGRIDVGQLMSRATSDPTIVQEIIQGMMAELARAPFEILAALVFIVWFAVANHMLATLGIIAIGLPAFMIPIAGLGKKVRRWSRGQLENASVVGGRIHEILTCIRVVKAYNAEAFENEQYETVNRKLLRVTMKAVRCGLAVGPVVETIGVLLICGFLVWCFSTHVTLSNVLPMLAPLLLVYKPIKQLSNLQVNIEVTQASLQRIWSVLDLDHTLPERKDAPEKRTFDDCIAFEDVSFRYETAERDAVSHVSFEIPRGSMVAVVGGTGSGKTTLSGLLARFFDPQSGRVTMDGTDLRDLRVSDLRALVGSVQQETILFNDTIEENIRYGSPSATHDEVVAAAKLANAHDFIVSQPGGYSRLAGEKGFALSGGERQRIAIARAILRNPPVLILDEATSALDTVTERLVQDALGKLMANRTVFAIAHRLSTVRDANLILVMENGRIAERGTHEQLLAANGVYRRLCDLQATTEK